MASTSLSVSWFKLRDQSCANKHSFSPSFISNIVAAFNIIPFYLIQNSIQVLNMSYFQTSRLISATASMITSLYLLGIMLKKCYLQFSFRIDKQLLPITCHTMAKLTLLYLQDRNKTHACNFSDDSTLHLVQGSAISYKLASTSNYYQ